MDGTQTHINSLPSCSGHHILTDAWQKLLVPKCTNTKMMLSHLETLSLESSMVSWMQVRNQE